MTEKTNVLKLSTTFFMEPKGSLFFDAEELNSALLTELKSANYNVVVSKESESETSKNPFSILEIFVQKEKESIFIFEISKSKSFVVIEFSLLGDFVLSNKIQKAMDKHVKKMTLFIDEFKKKHYNLTTDNSYNACYKFSMPIDGTKVIAYLMAKDIMKESDLKYESWASQFFVVTVNVSTKKSWPYCFHIVIFENLMTIEMESRDKVIHTAQIALINDLKNLDALPLDVTPKEYEIKYNRDTFTLLGTSYESSSDLFSKLFELFNTNDSFIAEMIEKDRMKVSTVYEDLLPNHTVIFTITNTSFAKNRFSVGASFKIKGVPIFGNCSSAVVNTFLEEVRPLTSSFIAEHCFPRKGFENEFFKINGDRFAFLEFANESDLIKMEKNPVLGETSIQFDVEVGKSFGRLTVFDNKLEFTFYRDMSGEFFEAICNLVEEFNAAKK